MPALQDWLRARGAELGSLFCAVLKTGALVREGNSGMRRLSAWALVRESGRGSGRQRSMLRKLDIPTRAAAAAEAARLGMV